MFSCKLLNKAKNLFLTKLNYTEKKNKQTLNLLETVTNTNAKTSKKKKKKNKAIIS